MRKNTLCTKKNKFFDRAGFTLIELIMTIVIAAVIIIPTSVIVYESIRNAFLPEYITISSSLLEAQLERVTNLRFESVVNEGPINFGGDFSNYSYGVNVFYVNPGDLNMQIGFPSDYKRVEITIFHLGLPDVKAVTLLTNN